MKKRKKKKKRTKYHEIVNSYRLVGSPASLYIERRNTMQNLKNTTKEQKEILSNAESILYTCKNDLGNFIESEVIKSDGKYYRLQATNKHITEFTEV